MAYGDATPIFGTKMRSHKMLCLIYHVMHMGCPLHIALGAEIHMRTGSQFLIDVLDTLGVYISPNQSRDFEKMLCYLKFTI